MGNALAILGSVIFIVSGIVVITILILDHKYSLKEYELKELQLKAQLKNEKNKRSGEKDA